MSGRNHGKALCMLIPTHFQLLSPNLDRRHALQLLYVHLHTSASHTWDVSDVLCHTHVVSAQPAALWRQS